MQLVARITTYLTTARANVNRRRAFFCIHLTRFWGARPPMVARAARLRNSQLPEAGGHGQIYLAPSGALKQPIDSGNTIFGSQSTALGKKIAKAIVAKKIT